MGVAPRLDAPASEEAPHPDSAWWGVHAARYRFALSTLDFTRLLDVACGTGYGLAILSGKGKVVGVDVDREALAAAREAAPVLAADGCVLPFADATFDAVTTFETLEHLEHRDAFLAELARVVVPGGHLVLSTPNALYTMPVDGKPRNPFHVFEYTAEELSSALRSHFVDVKMFGQTISPRFVISPFIDDQRRLPRTPTAQLRLFVWRVLNKLPPRIRDRSSLLLWKHPLFPSDDDYVFDADSVATAPVLVVTATAPDR